MDVQLEGTQQLALCPFCAYTPNLKTATANTTQGALYWVKCSNPKCAATTLSDASKDVALSHWNHREPQL